MQALVEEGCSTPPTEEEVPPAHIAHAIQVLNEALSAEPAVTSGLLSMHVPVSDALDTHPSIQINLYGELGTSQGRWLSAFDLVNGVARC